MTGEEIPEGQPLPVCAKGSGQAYEISEWWGQSWEGRFFEVQTHEKSQDTKVFRGKTDFRLPAESAISQRLSMAIVDGEIELTDCDLIQIGQSTIKPLGKQWICLRWPGRNKWLKAPFLILPNTFFEDGNMPWDMAFSKCRTKSLIGGYPDILYRRIHSTLLGEILEGPNPKNVLVKDWERLEQYVEIITEQFRVLIFVVGEVDHTKVLKWLRWSFYTGFESEVHSTCLKYIDEHRPDELYAVLVVGGTARTFNYRNPLFECSKDQSDMLSKLKAYLERNLSKATEIRERFASSNQRNLNGTSKANYEGLGFTAAAVGEEEEEKMGEKP